MAIESPIAVSIISRTPNAATQTAGFLILMMLALWIESPVIDLLSTATTLATGQRSLEQIRRFAVAMMLWTGVLHALVACTPLFDLITLGLLRLPPEVAESVRWPLIFMIPWSPAIGWRRWQQGIMIKNGQTRAISMGTLLRMFTIAGVGFGLLQFSDLPGIQVAAIALSGSVMVEAFYIHRVAGPSLQQQAMRASRDEPLSFGQIWRFHWPLTAATMVTLTATPLVGAYLAQVPDAVTQMAAWQVAASLAWLFRTVTFALPEAVIALHDEPRAHPRLRWFCLSVGISMAAAMVLGVVTGGVYQFFTGPLAVESRVAEWAVLGFSACLALPILAATMSYVRARLTVRRVTMARLAGIAVGIAGLVLVLALGVRGGMTGVYLAAAALTVGHLGEFLVQAFWWNRLRRGSVA